MTFNGRANGQVYFDITPLVWPAFKNTGRTKSRCYLEQEILYPFIERISEESHYRREFTSGLAVPMTCAAPEMSGSQENEAWLDAERQAAAKLGPE